MSDQRKQAESQHIGQRRGAYQQRPERADKQPERTISRGCIFPVIIAVQWVLWKGRKGDKIRICLMGSDSTTIANIDKDIPREHRRYKYVDQPHHNCSRPDNTHYGLVVTISRLPMNKPCT